MHNNCNRFPPNVGELEDLDKFYIYDRSSGSKRMCLAKTVAEYIQTKDDIHVKSGVFDADTATLTLTLTNGQTVEIPDFRAFQLGQQSWPKFDPLAPPVYSEPHQIYVYQPVGADGNKTGPAIEVYSTVATVMGAEPDLVTTGGNFWTEEIKKWRDVGDIRGWGYVGDYRMPDGSVNPSPTDNRQAWDAAILDATPGSQIVVMKNQPGYVSHSSGTIQIPKEVSVFQHSPQYCDNDAHNFALWDYDGGAKQFGDFRFDIRPTNQNPTWANTNEVALRIRNCQEIDCDIKAIWGFCTGLELIGENNAGVAHCTFNLGLLFDNKIDIKFYGTGLEGYVNQNTFNQGQFITSSSLNQTGSRFGVVIDHENDYKHNSNVFYNPSFEKKSDPLQDNVAVVIRSGRSNVINNARVEMKNGMAMMRTEGGSERNVFTHLFTNLSSGLINNSTATNNVVSAVYDAPYDFEVFNIGKFSDHIKTPIAGQVAARGVDIWRASSSSPFYWDGSGAFRVSTNNISLGSGAACGRLVNTIESKKLSCYVNFSQSTLGRIVCIPFNENMTPITDLSEFKAVNSQVIASEGASFTGGAFTAGVNGNELRYVIEVPISCAFLWVGAYAKGATAICNQLSVSAVKSSGYGLISQSPGLSSSAIPTLTSGFEINDFFYRLNRAQGQSKGWSFDGSVWFED